MKPKAFILAALAFSLLVSMTGPQPVYSENPAPSWYAPAENRPALDVPYVPTPEEVVNEMLNLAGVNSRDILYDLGCGDGRIVVTAAKERNVRRAVGVDLDPRRIEQSRENARQAGVTARVSFQQKDLFAVDMKEATVVSLYLLPTINLKLRPKLLRDLKPGARIVSHDFNMGDWQPDREVQLNEHTIYFWVVPSSVNGTWQWSFPDGARTRRYKLHLKQHFQNVYRAELKVDGIETAVRNIKLTGNKLEFAVEEGVNGANGAVHFKGSVNGNSITGTVSSKGGPSGLKGKWAAQRMLSKEIPVDASSADKTAGSS